MRNFADLVKTFTEIINLGVLLLFGLTLVVIIWYIVKAWIIKGGDTASVEEGKKVALAGVIALVIMSGIWGILYILRNSLFVG